MTFAPLELISAHPWRRTAFTTYALSLSFFEVVLLDGLVRGGAREALILSDVEGVRAALGEQGARRAGKDYLIEPIAVDGGVFHPKISALTAENDAHLLVGSGNVTFGGWGANLEVVEHLHPSFAADAVDDAAAFFDSMQTAAHLRHGASQQCAAIAEDLRAAARNGRRNGDIRLFHNLDGPISRKVAQAVDDLGGAERLVVAAPFWDEGRAIDHLCAMLGLDQVFVHSHARGTVEGTAGSNWPARARSAVHAIRLGILEESKPRLLHAKAFEIACKKGRILVSGSANATWAALHGERNVEACVARIQRERKVGWRFSRVEAPALRAAPDEEDERKEAHAGVLRAVLEGDRITGRILTPNLNGPASALQLTTEGPELLGQTIVNPDGSFQVSAPALEVQSWKSGRLVLRIIEAASDRRAEGFVSVLAFAAIMRRAGAMAPRLLAVLAGTETPADVAAIMSWFHEDPRRLVDARPAVSGANTDKANGNGRDTTIDISELNSRHAAALDAPAALNSEGAAGWPRFMAHILAAFRERRGPFGRTTAGRSGEDDEDDGAQGPDAASSEDPDIERSLKFFEHLLELMLSPENALRHAMAAFDITQYICERLQPSASRAKAWLERIVADLVRCAPQADRRPDVAAAILTLMGARSDGGGDRTARARLLQLGFDMSGEPPAADVVQGFQTVLTQSAAFPDLWARVKTVRTFPEQVKAYLRALEARRALSGYEDLAHDTPEEWPILEAAIRSDGARKRILVLDHWSEACPKCHMMLPTGQLQRLGMFSVAKAKNCCDRVILWPGS